MEHHLEIVSLPNDIEDYAAIDRVVMDDSDGKTVPGETLNVTWVAHHRFERGENVGGLTLDSLAEQV